MVQIGTGEGKSVTLAITSIILALLGIDVYCACYSSQLSKRDYKDFEEIFGDLGVKDKISYGTFNELCEEIINKDCNIRQEI